MSLHPTPSVSHRQSRFGELDAARQALRTLVVGILSEEDLIFSEPDGTPLKPDTVSNAFQRIAWKAGLHGIRFHDLRHTHATLMLQQGVHPKIVQERLGHATIAVTMDTYSHVLPGMQAEAVQRLGEAFTQALAGATPRCGDASHPMQSIAGTSNE